MPVIMKDNVQYAYTTKGTVFHTLSNAEYEALTEEEKMNGDVYCIPDREPVINPDQLWEKVGTGTLDIGDDLTDGVNQVYSSLNNSLNNLKFKFVSKSITIPDGSTSSPKTVDVDLSSDLPTGASIVGVMSASIGAYKLPYTSNSGASQTWVYRVTNNTTVVLENTTTGWGTQTAYLLVAYS